MANPVTKIRNTAADYRKLDGRDKRRFWTDGILNNALYILMAIFIIYTAIVNHNFLKIGSITNIISLAAASLPFALGVAGCIVLTGTDLSGGRVVGLSAALSAALLQKTDLARRMFSWMPNIPTWAGICIAILAVIAIGAIIGFVNGFFVAKFKLHPFIVTLATQLITYGLILVFFMLNDNNGQPLSGLSDGYSSFIKGKMISIGAVSLPWYVLYAIILLVITWFLWNKTTFGKNMFAVGSNAEAANVSGVNVFRTTVLVHTFAGVMYGLTGFIEGARISSITQSTGLNYECDAIAACVIGGVSFVGGTGKISGIVLGVLILRIIFAALTFLAIDSSLQYISRASSFWSPALWICASTLSKSKDNSCSSGPPARRSFYIKSRGGACPARPRSGNRLANSAQRTIPNAAFPRCVIARSEATWQSRSTRSNNRKAAANTVTLRCGASRTPSPTTPARKPRKIFRFLLPACPVPAGLP